MFLCQSCKSIEVQHLPSATGVTLRPDEFEAAPSQPHYRSFFSLQDSAKTCKLCHLLFKGLKVNQDERLPSGCAYIRMGHTDWTAEDPPLTVEPVNIRALSRSSCSAKQKQLYGIQVTCGYGTCEFGLYADDGSRAKKVLMVVGEQPEPV
ncbi:hypothetical protein K456DRAFT_922999 [Colletotrichum gloeosporioides 23]|nr:hypothetical protein K456DRAFT_922999 [Colletotrichum gloeosporioides 23]